MSTPFHLQRTLRRLLDFTVSFIALVLLSPLLLIIALAIMIDSPGNPFHLARRIGQSGSPFVMYKFRTMILNASQVGPAITGRSDPRITRLGRFLRKTKLDELPQFINVLIGDMSLVGPRPEAPEIVAIYTAYQRRILEAKPGLTGKLQIEGDESELIPEGAKADEYYRDHLMDRKLRSDLDYLQVRTLTSDVRILMSTALFVLRSFARR